MVRTLRSGVSRGTETLVFRGSVPPSQYAAMRAPFQEGDFPGPVKYGYLNVGVVEEGPPELRGRTVFCLYPAPDGLRRAGRRRVRRARRRAARPRRARRHGRDRGQRAVGCAPRWSATGSPSSAPGMVGCCVARLLARFPAVDVTLVDVDAVPRRGRGGARRRLRAAGRRRRRLRPGRAHQRDLGRPAAAPSTCSRRRGRCSSSAGTATPRCASRSAAPSTRGGWRSGPARSARSRRPGAHVARPADRLALALDLLRDPAFDALLTGESRFDELPDVMARLADGSLPALCHTITYDEE